MRKMKRNLAAAAAYALAVSMVLEIGRAHV